MSGVDVAAIPIIATNEAGDEEVVACNAAAVCGEPGYNKTYWSEYELLVANTTGAVFNKFNAVDIPAYNASNDQYDLWDVLHDWDGSANPAGDQDFFLRSETCFSAAHSWAKILRDKHGVELLADVVKEDFITLYAHEMPTEVDMSDPEQERLVVKFYKIFTGGFADMFLKLIERAWHHNMYTFHAGKFYKVNDHMPYFRWHYAPIQLVD